MNIYKEIIVYLQNRDEYTESERKEIKDSLRKRLNDLVDGIDFINKL